MGHFIELKTINNHTFQSYISQPKREVKGGLIVIQEIFGVNTHIKDLCNKFSKLGFLSISPCLFDRENKNIELDYSKDSVEYGRQLKEKFNDFILDEIESSISYVKAAGKVGAIGYCWGGSICWRSSCTFDDLSTAVIYYGGDVPKLSNLKPKCPVMCHFGEYDKSIPIDEVEGFKKKNSEVKIYKYPADHGFNCDKRSQFNKRCSEIALERTLKFLNENLT